MYILTMTIDHHYWKHDHECYYARQVEKKTFESHFWKQGKASSAGNAMVSQNKASTSLVASSTKLFLSKLSFPAPKKQSNFLWIDFSFKLANNGKLTSDKYKKHLENNLYLYCSAEDYKLDSCLKNQTMITLKCHNASVTAFKKPLEK